MSIRSRFRPGMTPREFTRAYLPEADDDFADWILWGTDVMACSQRGDGGTAGAGVRAEPQAGNGVDHINLACKWVEAQAPVVQNKVE